MTTDDQRPVDPAVVPPADAATTPAPPAPPEPTPADATPATADPDAVPDEATLAATARPARVRRAPRFGAFVRTGVVVGAVLGWLGAMLASGTSGEARTAVVLISTVVCAAAGALLAAGVAAVADRRSTRRTRG